MAIIRFLEDVELKIELEYNSIFGPTDVIEKFFEEGEEIEVEIINENQNHISFEFTNGSVCLNLNKNFIEVEDGTYY